MKRIVLTSIAIISFLLNGKAQEQKTKTRSFDKISIGVTAGTAFNTFNGKEAETNSYAYAYNPGSAFNTGIEGVVKWNNIIQTTIGVGYNNQSFKRTEQCFVCDNDYTPKVDFKMNYLEIPVSLQVYLVNDRLDIFLNAAFNSNLLMKARELRPDINGYVYEYDSKSMFNNYLAGFSIGSGINYNLTYRGSLGLTLNYNHTITTIGDDPELAHRGLRLKAGYYYMF